MNKRTLSLLIASTIAVCSVHAEGSSFWNDCKDRFNQFTTQAREFGQSQYSSRKEQASDYWKSGQLQKQANVTAQNWNNPAGYVGGFTGLFSVLAANRFFKTPVFRRFAPITIAATFGTWAAQRGKGCVEAHFPEQALQKNDNDIKKEA